MVDQVETRRASRRRSARTATQRARVSARLAASQLRQDIKRALARPPQDRTAQEQDLIATNQALVNTVLEQQERYKQEQSRKAVLQDDARVVEQHAARLLHAMIRPRARVVVYTGAGISTAANIPDYRGPAGLWARAQRGEAPESIARDLPNLADCTPTYTHMVLARLVAVGAVDFIVSQNCDGLHLRSGVPASKLAEIHGNCFIEVCPACHKVYRRRFDVSAQSRVRRHTTRRTCTHCTQQHQHTEQQQPQPQQQPQQQHQQQPPSPRPLLTAAPCPRDGVHLEDTIVHFGETTRHASVANWGAAMAAAAAATVVVVLGSSLKVLKAYPCLWKRVKQRKCELFIVNSQWTPLDRWAVQKTHSDVDAFMRALVAAHDRAPAAGDGSGGGGASRGVSNDEHGGAPKSVVKKEEEEEEEDEDQRQQDYDQDHDQEEEELKSVAPAALVNGSWRPQTYVREEDPFWQQCDDDDGDNDDDDDARAPGGWLMAGLKRSAHRK